MHFVLLHSGLGVFELKPVIESCSSPPFDGNVELQLILHGCGRVVGKPTRQYIFLHVGPVHIATFTGCRPAVNCSCLSKEGFADVMEIV